MLTSVIALARLLTLLQGTPDIDALPYIQPVTQHVREYAQEYAQQFTLDDLEALPGSDARGTMCMLPGILQCPVASLSSLIVSIQAATVTIGSGATSNTGTITSVTAANASLFFGGENGGNVNYDVSAADITLTNSTTLTATRNTSATQSVNVDVTIVEWTSSAAKSVQYGTATIASSATTGTATITAVTQANSACLFEGYTCAVASNSAENIIIPYLTLTSTTQVTATRNTSTTSAVTARFCNLEFNSGILNSSTQSGTIQIASGGTSNTATITAVTAANSIIGYGGQITSNGSGAGNAYGYAQLTSGTVVTFTRVSSSTITTTLAYTVIEFKASSLDTQAVQRGTIVIASSGTTNTATITSVTTTKTAITYQGQSNSAADTTGSRTWATDVLTNATTVTAARDQTTTNTDTVSYETVSFK